MALNYITSIFTGQSVFVETTTAGAPTATAARGSIAIINVAGAVEVYINDSVGTTGNSWVLIGGGSASTVSYDPTRSGLVFELTGLPANTVQGAIDAIASGQIVSEFVFDPNIAADVGNRYKTFASLYTALSRTSSETVRRIYFQPDLSLGSQLAIIPAGTYDFKNVQWIGIPRSNAVGVRTDVILDIDDGAVVVAGGYPPCLIQNLTLQFQGTTTFCTIPAANSTYIRFDKSGTGKSIGTTPPFVLNAASGRLLIDLINGSSIGGVFGAPLIDVQAGGVSCYIYARDNSQLDFTTLAIDVTSSANLFQVGATAGIIGQSVYSPLNLGALYWNYTPNSVSDWLGTAPTGNANALDRLAVSPSSEGMLGLVDPGNVGFINADIKDGEVAILPVAAGETRTVNAPGRLGQMLSIVADAALVAPADATITFGAAFNFAGNTNVQITAPFQGALFIASNFGAAGALVWRLVSNDGTTLS